MGIDPRHGEEAMPRKGCRAIAFSAAEIDEGYAEPRGSAAANRKALGFAVDAAIDEIVQAFIEDDLQMQEQLVRAHWVSRRQLQ